MIGGLKFLPFVAGAVGAASLVGVSVFSPEPVDDTGSAATDVAGKPASLCFKSDVDFWRGLRNQCLSRDDISALWDAPLIANGRSVEVELTHPSDLSVAAVECKTCRQYAEMQWDGWYALTSRDMRREARFVFACGTLELLERARLARASYFINGSPTSEEMQTLGSTLLLRITDGSPLPDAGLEVEEQADAMWSLLTKDYAGRVQEIVNADFTGDGIEDVLVFLYSAPIEGTASVAAVAVLEKTMQNGPVSVSFQSFRQGQGGI
ncbi:MAG: hypothetical protein AAFX54_18520 [Pseudomonadota bacterium]